MSGARITAAQARKLGLEPKRTKLPKAKPVLRGEPRQCINMTLPWPPSINTYYAVVHGRKVLSKRGREFKEAVKKACDDQYIQHVIGKLRLSIYVEAPNKRRFDLDNLIKPIQDAIVDAGCFADDSQITRLEIMLRNVGSPGDVFVSVWGELP